MQSPRIALGAGLVALVAGVAVYSSIRTPQPRPGLALMPPSATARPPGGSLNPAVSLGGERPRSAVVLGGERPRPPVLGDALPSRLGDDARRASVRDEPAPGTATPGDGTAEDGPAAAARRLLALLPGDDCPRLIRFADDQSDRYRGDATARALVDALEAAQQYCYQRERFPEIASERRQEAERFAQRFLGEKPRRSALP